MRQFIIVIFLLHISINLFSQRERSSWNDTTFIPIVLNDTISDKKIVIVNIGEKATILDHKLDITLFRGVKSVAETSELREIALVGCCIS